MDQSKDISLIPGYEQFTNYDIDITGKMRNYKTNRHNNGYIQDGHCIFTLRQDGFKKRISLSTALRALFGVKVIKADRGMDASPQPEQEPQPSCSPCA